MLDGTIKNGGSGARSWPVRMRARAEPMPGLLRIAHYMNENVYMDGRYPGDSTCKTCGPTDMHYSPADREHDGRTGQRRGQDPDQGRLQRDSR